MFFRGWKCRVAKLEAHLFHRQAERVRRDLRRRGVGARPHVSGGAAHGHGSIGEECGGRGRGIARDVVDRRRHPEPDEFATVSIGARTGRAAVPAEPLRPLPIALAQRLRGPRQILHRILLGVVEQAQLDGIELQLFRQLVHCHLLPNQAGCPARPSHGAGRADVHGHQAVAGPPVRAGVGGGCGCERGFSKLFVGGGLPRDLMDHGGEPAVAASTEGYALSRLGTEANRGEELPPGQLQPHRKPGTAGSHCSQRDMRPGA